MGQEINGCFAILQAKSHLTISLFKVLLSLLSLKCVGWGGQKRNAMIAQAAEKVVDQEASLGPKGAEESEAVRAVVSALMHELECILHEYLSFNWDRAEDIYEANKKMLHSGDLPSLWKSVPMLSVSIPILWTKLRPYFNVLISFKPAGRHKSFLSDAVSSQGGWLCIIASDAHTLLAWNHFITSCMN